MGRGAAVAVAAFGGWGRACTAPAAFLRRGKAGSSLGVDQTRFMVAGSEGDKAEADLGGWCGGWHPVGYMPKANVLLLCTAGEMCQQAMCHVAILAHLQWENGWYTPWFPTIY